MKTAYERLLYEPPVPVPVVKPPPPPPVAHEHACPYCHAYWGCKEDCTLEPDLSGPGEPPRGHHHPCHDPSCQADYRRDHPWLFVEPGLPVPEEQMRLDFQPRVYELEDL